MVPESQERDEGAGQDHWTRAVARSMNNLLGKIDRAYRFLRTQCVTSDGRHEDNKDEMRGT